MQLLSTRWSVTVGQIALNGTVSASRAEEAILASASALELPAHPEGEVKRSLPCGLYDPQAPVVVHRFLDADGNTWLGVGVRAVANTPNPAYVEAEFRRRALAQLGETWASQKPRVLNAIRRQSKEDLAVNTPWRMSQAGAFFLCLQTGAVLVVGAAGCDVVADLMGRCAEWSSVSWPKLDKEAHTVLLAYLRSQSASRLPWPTGSASLVRQRGEVLDHLSVRDLAWDETSAEAQALLDAGWHPLKIQLMWGDERKAILDRSKTLASISWTQKLVEEDLSDAVERRLGLALGMIEQVRATVAAIEGDMTPLLRP